MNLRFLRLVALPSSALALAVGRDLADAAHRTGAGPPVTFTKDIAPILQRSCQNCHRPDSLAPMSLLTYEEARPYAAAIKRRTAIRSKQGTMPPWYIEKDIGIQHYKNDISLSDEEVAKIARWADSGAPQGNPADMPPPLTFADADGWTIGTPDLVVKTPPVSMKAVQPDWWGNAGFADTGLTEDRYVAAVEIKEVNDSQGKARRRTTVGGLFIFHHALMGVEAPGRRRAASPASWRLAGARSRTQRRRVQSRRRETAARRLARRLPQRPHARERQGHDRPPRGRASSSTRRATSRRSSSA